jgi:pullulanase
MAHMDNPNVLFKIGFFNDGFRETIKGATFQPKGLGFMSGGKLEPHNVMHAILGSTLNHRFKYPSQSLNYIECHDNYTVADKLRIALPDLDAQTKQAMQELGTAMVILSQGVPFIHMGQEFFRLKGGVENSYNAPDTVNHIDWDAVDIHQEAIRRFQFLLNLRQKEPLFRLKTLAQIKKHTSISFTRQGSVIYRLENDLVNYTVLFKPKPGDEVVELATESDIIFDTHEALKNNTVSIQASNVGCIIAQRKKESL